MSSRFTDLLGKTAVVTGAGSGIGRGIALRLAAESMTVGVLDLQFEQAEAVAAEITAAGGRAMAIEGDVTDPESLARAAARVESEMGRLNLLCANAGVLARIAPFDRHTIEDWEYTLSVNVVGIVKTVQAFVPLLRRSAPEAHIVNTASIGGLLTDQGIPVGAYVASKYACVAFSETLRAELEPDGIGVSVLCPGVVESNLAATSKQNRPAALSSSRPARPPQPSSAQPAPLEAVMPEPLSADAVADILVRAVRANRFHIFTHPDDRSSVAERFRAIDDDFAFLESNRP